MRGIIFRLLGVINWLLSEFIIPLSHIHTFANADSANIPQLAGAQSGGVVTFEPALSGPAFYNSDCQAPIMRGKRSRVVNAKRTVLSKGVRSKLVRDNRSIFGNNKLTGWNADEFNDPKATGKRLVRGFFGHTRFATSSKASMDGTHPHQWSPRRNYTVFPFQSAAASKLPSRFQPKSQRLGVENFVTHNGTQFGFCVSFL